MLLVASIVLPVFGLIALGLLSVRIGLLPPAAAEGLGAFMYRIGVPCLVFRALADADLPADPDFGFWIGYFTGVAVAWLIAEIVARRCGLDGKSAIIAGVSASFSNTVLIGIGLVANAYGTEGLVPLFLLVSIHLPFLGLIITLRLESDGGGGPAAAIVKTARGLATNPIIIGIVTGIIFNVSGLGLPDIAAPVIVPLADAAVPVALFTAGATLSSYLREGLSLPVGVAALAKLVVMPALVWVMVFHVFTMPDLYAQVAVLLAACPAGINAYLFAQPYARALPIASGTIAVTTLIAVFTVSFWLVLLKAA